MEPILNATQRPPKGDLKHYAINTYRFDFIYNLINKSWLVHVLDRLIYRCQHSTLSRSGQPAFTEKLADLVAYIGESSVAMFRRHAKALQALDLIQWQTCYTRYGKQTMISLTPKLMTALAAQQRREAIARLKREGIVATADQPTLLPFYQAENHWRYEAITPLLGAISGRQVFFCQHVLSGLMQAIEREAHDGHQPLADTAVALSQPYLASRLHLSVRTLQRYLSHLVKQGLVVITRRKIGPADVETRYAVKAAVWAAATQANRAMAKAKTAHEEAAPSSGPVSASASRPANDTPLPPSRASEPSALFGGTKPALFGGRNSNINKKSHINKNHSTVTSKQTSHVTRETCQNNEHHSIVNLKQVSKRGEGGRGDLNTVLNGNTPLNRRQMRYLRGMLAKLQQQHGCQFSNPSGLLEEITFAVQQIHTIFVGRHRFCHRVNLIAKLLREQRWTTPHGYERYDAKGQAQKARREARAAAWAAEKTGQASPLERPAIRPTGAAVLGRLLPRLGASPPPSSPSVPPEITERLVMMKRLAERAQAPDCSEAARAGITALLQQHQAAIQAAMATTETVDSATLSEGGGTV